MDIINQVHEFIMALAMEFKEVELVTVSLILKSLSARGVCSTSTTGGCRGLTDIMLWEAIYLVQLLIYYLFSLRDGLWHFRITWK